MLATDPARGEDIDKDGTIALTLSKGPERYDVPNVVERTEEVARSMIEDSNLTVGDVEQKYSSKVDEGVVISADPEVGTELKRDQAVTLVVSRERSRSRSRTWWGCPSTRPRSPSRRPSCSPR